jgi:hypothetical protein
VAAGAGAQGSYRFISIACCPANQSAKRKGENSQVQEGGGTVVDLECREGSPRWCCCKSILQRQTRHWERRWGQLLEQGWWWRGSAWTATRRGGAARFFHRESLGLGDGQGGAVRTQEVGSGHPGEWQRIGSDGPVILDSQTIEIFSPGDKSTRGPTQGN